MSLVDWLTPSRSSSASCSIFKSLAVIVYMYLPQVTAHSPSDFPCTPLASTCTPMWGTFRFGYCNTVFNSTQSSRCYFFYFSWCKYTQEYTNMLFKHTTITRMWIARVTFCCGNKILGYNFPNFTKTRLKNFIDQGLKFEHLCSRTCEHASIKYTNAGMFCYNTLSIPYDVHVTIN